MVQDFDSSYVGLLECLKKFTQNAVKDLILPIRIQKKDEKQVYRPADVYLMRLPDSNSATKKAPYIIHQLLTTKDLQEEGHSPTSGVQVRSLFCVYSDDEQEGGLMLAGLVDRFRISLLREVVIGKRYSLNLKAGAEALFYQDNTAPYFAAEMVTTWKIPSIEREVRKWL